MKAHLLLLSMATLGSSLVAQNCTDLFFSEYIEGNFNNKALELYNPTNAPIDLGSYRIIRWDNGSTPPLNGDIETVDPSKVSPLPSGVFIPAKGTYVIALNLTDPAGSGQTAPIDPALQAKADTLLSNGCAPDPGNRRTFCFNGDDAMELQRFDDVAMAWVSVDIFGSIGERPTNSSGNFNPTAGWTAIPPFSSMPANYNSTVDGPYFRQYWSQDQTLVRKPSVTGGVTTNPAPETFNPSVEWDSVGVDVFDSLGAHTCVCSTLSLDELTGITTLLYPNPAQHTLTLAADADMTEVTILDLQGREVFSAISLHDPRKISMDVSKIGQGWYIVRIGWLDGKTSIQRFIKE